ncbi:MAG: hypothetical protein KAY37_06090 [Phycisphaerae bacterium]|nr:hypothetical protein [Phycisphaerae bacterium]
MKLKFRGSPQPLRYPQFQRHDQSWQPLELDGRYEVAEIFEMDGYLMVRQPGERRWPVPGSRWFGWPPELFEPTELPLPIVSCGFKFNDFLTDFFGVILNQPEYIEIARTLKDVGLPEEDEEYERWRTREAADFPHETVEFLYELLQLPVPWDFGVCENVFLADEPVKAPFGYMGCFLAELARHDVSTIAIEEHLGRFLAAFGVQGFEVTEINLPFWQGTGGERLINAPPDGRLIYGTENDPIASESNS